ncbi:hypothetical protein QL285_004160 [Trifolium repens]|nr:hypothetical protein QL285_004160 [Trifolium repens]
MHADHYYDNHIRTCLNISWQIRKHRELRILLPFCRHNSPDKYYSPSKQRHTREHTIVLPLTAQSHAHRPDKLYVDTPHLSMHIGQTSHMQTRILLPHIPSHHKHASMQTGYNLLITFFLVHKARKYLP